MPEIKHLHINFSLFAPESVADTLHDRLFSVFTRLAALFCGVFVHHDEFACRRIIAVNGVIKLVGGLKPSLFGFFVDKHRCEIINDRKQRNADHHTDKSEHTAEQQQRERDPEFAHTGRVSEYLRADYVAVDLLKNDYEYTEQHTLRRVDHKHNESRRNTADKRSEKRYYVRHADDCTDKQ